MNKTELAHILVVSALLTLSFPPFPLGFLAPVAIAIFMGFIKTETPAEVLRLGFWLGLWWAAMTLFWIATNTLLGAIFAILVKALQVGLLWWIYSQIKSVNEKLALITLPVLWVALEYLTLFSDLRFNWLTLAHTQTYYLPLLQIIEHTGYHLLSFLVASAAVCLYLLFYTPGKNRHVPLVIVTGVILLIIIYGVLRIRQLDRQQHLLLKASLVQPNVDPYLKWDPAFETEAFRILMAESQKLISQNPDIIVWPETATPFYLRTRIAEMDQIYQLVDSQRVSLLTGAPDLQYGDDVYDPYYYNAAFFFQPEELGFQRYYKMALVPGSEMIPFEKYFPLLRRIAKGAGDYSPGHQFAIFKFKIPARYGRFSKHQYQVDPGGEGDRVTASLSAIICYESVFPNLARQFILNGANLLTVITNDGWFGMTTGPYQHARYAILRSIENRVSIIRCANTGISCLIDPAGRVLDQADLNTRKNLTGLIPLGEKNTIYTLHGEWFGLLCLIISFTFIFFILFYHRFFRS